MTIYSPAAFANLRECHWLGGFPLAGPRGWVDPDLIYGGNHFLEAISNNNCLSGPASQEEPVQNRRTGLEKCLFNQPINFYFGALQDRGSIGETAVK